MEEKEKQVAKRESRPLSKVGFTFLPETWEQLYNYAKEISQTDFVPNDLRGKPGAVLAAWQFGQEIGLAPMAALQSIAVINGRPSLWGDGALAIVRSSPLCEYIHELAPDQALEKGYGECTVKRRDDEEPITRRFTKAMAEQAGLWGGKSKDAEKKKFEPWFNYPGRMLQMRARAWAMRDAIPEALRGISIREEVEDIEPRDVTPQEEPLKIPQPIKGGKNDGSNSDPGTAVEAVALNTQQPIADDGKNTEGTGTETEKAKSERSTLVKDKTYLLNWIAKEATKEELLATENEVTRNLKGKSGQEQVEICREWNRRKKEFVADAKT